MLFSSIIFLCYFLPITVAVYVLVSFSRLLQNAWLLLVSLVFYAWGEPLFVLFMILSIFANTLFGWMVDRRHKAARSARWVVAIAVIFNIGVLFVVKYLGFALDNINAVLGFDFFEFEGFVLPLGISFFTFQALSYVLDVYRGDAEVEKNPFYVGLYIALFPQLVAGPIVRFADIAAQLRGRVVTWDSFSAGCSRFVIGLGKKTLIANAMGAIADRVFDLSAAGSQVVFVPSMLAWVGLFAYTMQIYFDFSAYSDMAIGLGRLFGFEFKENFNYPYISTSVTEFWRRWHISLSTWFREYLYFPLGGSRPETIYGKRIGAGRRSALIIRNLFVVWLATGVWHGADWTFIIWGMWYFVFILFERVTKFTSRDIPKVVGHTYLILVAMIGWMFFRAGNAREAMVYLSNLLGINDNGFYSPLAMAILREYWLFFVLTIVFSTPFARNLGGMLERGGLGPWRPIFCAAYPFLLLFVYGISVVYLAKGTYAPFIYFNF